MGAALTCLGRIVTVVVLAAAFRPALGQPVYSTQPGWISANPHYSTGAALVDLDRDGDLDIVIADGNDMARGRLNVYENLNGTFATTASWQSDDLVYNGHLDVADVDADGWPDVAVATLVTDDVEPSARIYRNTGGTLSSLPTWQSSQTAPAFAVAFGDVNRDGRPDLAVMTGFAYTNPAAYHNYLHINQPGAGLDPTPDWQSDDTHDLMGGLFADVDADGALDLVAIAAGAQTRVYRNLGADLETTASWSTTDASGQFGIMADVGDVNRDGLPDLLTTDNTQLGGDGAFKLYPGLPAGLFQTLHGWNFYDGYGSAIALADLDNDGALDLATGAWWDHTRLFLNHGSGLPASPTWSSGPTSVVEKIVFGDVNPPCGIAPEVSETFSLQPNQRLVYLERRAIQSIDYIAADGVPLAPDQYTWNRERGWVAIGLDAAELLVEYTASASLDMVVSNWDPGVGNYLYDSSTIDDCNGNGQADGCDIFNGISFDTNANGIPDECESLCPADTTGDGSVDVNDLLDVLGNWGDCPPGQPCPADVNNDETVDVDDLLAVLAAWGPCR